MSSDHKKHDLNRVFKKRDREHREPTSPESEEEVYVIPDAERERMRLEEALQRGVNGMFEGLRNKARQKAYDAEYAAIKAEFDAELGQHERKKAAHPIPQRSLELDPKASKTDIKRRAPVVAIAKPAATPEKPAVESEEESEPPASWTSKESGTWSPETEEWLATLEAEPAPATPQEIEPAADPPVPETSTKKADPEQLLAQRRDLKRRLKEGHGLTKQEAAIYYNKTPRAIFTWCEKGRLKVVKKRGRITAKSILDFPPEDDLDGPE